MRCSICVTEYIKDCVVLVLHNHPSLSAFCRQQDEQRKGCMDRHERVLHWCRHRYAGDAFMARYKAQIIQGAA